ncbi:MAG: PadR family transcriptional regulator [Blastocatellia bacterium]
MVSKTEFPRLSRGEMLILEMLISKGELFGLEMVAFSNGELKRGTVYVTLQRMSDKGYVESREEPRLLPEVGIPRRKYRVTGHGEKAYQTNFKAAEFFNSDFAWGLK